MAAIEKMVDERLQEAIRTFKNILSDKLVEAAKYEILVKGFEDEVARRAKLKADGAPND